MIRKYCHIAFILLLLVSTAGYGQDFVDTVKVHKADSIKAKWSEFKDHVNNPRDTIEVGDTLSTIESSKYIHKLDSAEQKANSLISYPGNKVNGVSDSINNKLKSKIEGVKSSVKGKVNKKVDIPNNEVTQKAKTKIKDQVDIPDGQLPKGKVSDPSLKNVSISSQSNDVSDKVGDVTQMPGEKINGLKSGTGIDKVSGKVNEIQRVPGEKIGAVKNSSEVKQVTNGISEIKNKEESVKAINQNVHEMKEGNYEATERKLEKEAENKLEKEAENRLAKEGEIEALESQKKALEGQKAEIENQKTRLEEQKKKLEEYKKKKVIKDQLKQRAAKRGAEFFAKYQEKLQEAQGPYGSYKKKFLKGKKGKDKWLDFKPNAMKGKSLFERLIIGGYTQIVKLNTTSVDLSPILAYRLSGLFVIGAGYTYRLNLGNDGISPNLNSYTYGGRGYLDVKAYKGFYVHSEYESLRTDVPTQKMPNAVDITHRAWVNSVLIGIGKKYKIRNKVNGYIQALHNFSYDINRSPYARKLMIRVGVEGVLEGRKKNNIM